MIKKSISKFADDIGLTQNEVKSAMIETGLYNKSGSPKSKFVKSGILTSDGDIRSPKKFEVIFNQKLDECL